MTTATATPNPAPVRCPHCRRCLCLAAPPVAAVVIRCPQCRQQVTISGDQAITATLTHEGPGRSRAPPT